MHFNQLIIFFLLGFEVLESRDMAVYNPEYEIPWYDSLSAKWNYAGFKHTVPGLFPCGFSYLLN